MAINKVNFILKTSTRQDIRKELVAEFLKELPGSGKGTLTSRYYYTVETMGGYSIELHRPAGLNKGFDFVVHIIGMHFKKNKRYTNPSHIDIINVLLQLSVQSNYGVVKNELHNIFNLRQYNLSNVNGITFVDGDGNNVPIAIMLLAIRWLFIEQDMTYWNWSGRQMLWDGLVAKGLV